MTSGSLPRWRSVTLSLLGLIASGVMLMRSASLIEMHATLIREVGQQSLPLAATIPALEERKAILTQQLDVTQVSTSPRLGSLREQLHAYVFPEHPVDRALASLTALTDALKERGDLKDMSPISTGSAESSTTTGSQLQAQTLTLTVTVNEEGFDAISRFLNVSGLLTVADAMTPQQIQTLLTQTEQENPTGIVALGQFLSTDLVKYLQDPSAYDRRLLGEFSSSAFAATFSQITQSQSFEEEGEFLRGAVGQDILKQNLWPLPFLSVERSSITERSDGWQEMSLTLTVFGEDQKSS